MEDSAMNRATLYSAVAMLLMTGSALAATTPVTGTIKSVDPGKKIVWLDNGQSYLQGRGVEMMGLKPGTKVTLFYDMRNGRKVVEDYEFAR